MRAALGSSTRGVIVALFLFTLPGDVLADTFIIGSRGAIGSAYLGAAAGNALASGIELARTKAQANAQFAAARRRFFAEYPNGKDFAQAGKELSELLWQKDLYFLWVSLPTGFRDSSPNSMANVLGKVDALTGGTLDGGIPNAAAFRFDRWVTAVRGHLGAESYRAPLRRLPSASQLVAALDATRDRYAQYRRDRDEAELEMQCRARPGPYCAASAGSYSHGGNTGRAARIADHYLASYAQTLPGGEAMKATLRDAIIKYESLSYTTQDCIRTVDRLFQSESRRDPSMAALRGAIARYESAKVMSQEDICIRAAQDMQRDEARRNGTPSAAPAPKESWDTTFRTAKFNALYGSITAEQELELAQARGGRQDPSRIRATVIDFYTGGPAARAAQVRPYLYVRDKIIRTALPDSAAPAAPQETKQESDPGARPAGRSASRGASRACPDDRHVIVSDLDHAALKAKTVLAVGAPSGRGWDYSVIAVQLAYRDPKIHTRPMPEGELSKALERGIVDVAAVPCARVAVDAAGFFRTFGGLNPRVRQVDGSLRPIALSDFAPPTGSSPERDEDKAEGTKPIDDAMAASRAGDRERARALFEKACEDGDAGGCYQAAFMVGTGQGGPLDQGRARAFYERACTGGDARGCVNLGYFFSAGIGGPQDLVRARGLYEQACKAGIRSGCSRAATISRRLKQGGKR